MIEMTFELRNKVYYITLEDGREFKVMDKEINHMVERMDIDVEEALEIWLDDEGHTVNEEQNELCEKAKVNKVNVQAKTAPVNKTHKERVRKENPTKEGIISAIAAHLETLDATDVVIENAGKIITFKVDGIDFKFDLVQKRAPKEKK